jgi:hypothetical protein
MLAKIHLLMYVYEQHKPSGCDVYLDFFRNGWTVVDVRRLIQVWEPTSTSLCTDSSSREGLQ